MTETSVTPTVPPEIEAKQAEIVALCQRFGVVRLDMFGSSRTGEFDSFISDYDLLVTDPDPDFEICSRTPAATSTTTVSGPSPDRSCRIRSTSSIGCSEEMESSRTGRSD